jgi:hypothetical protein
MSTIEAGFAAVDHEGSTVESDTHAESAQQ